MTTTEQARHFPKMPPMLPTEGPSAYTGRLTGADGTGRIPYDHPRNRQCSIGYHGECSDPAGERCKCPCHTGTGKLEMRADEMEELFIAAWSLASGARSGDRGEGIRKSIAPEAGKLTARRPELAEWYLSPDRAAEAQEQDGPWLERLREPVDLPPLAVLDMDCRGGNHAGCVGPPGTVCECHCHASPPTAHTPQRSPAQTRRSTKPGHPGGNL